VISCWRTFSDFLEFGTCFNLLLVHFDSSYMLPAEIPIMFFANTCRSLSLNYFPGATAK